MSTVIFDALKDTSVGRNISLFVVNNGRPEIEDLADYVRRTRSEKEMSLRDVEVRSGHSISKGYVGQIENRVVLGQSVTPQKLRALARGLGVSEDEIFAIARGKPVGELDDLRVSFFGGGQDLTQEDWDEVMTVARSLIQQKSRKRKK